MSPALSLQDVHYFYRSDFFRTRLHALKGVSVEIATGEFFGFLGHNGGGKTTTIKCILGLIKPVRGRIEIFGKSNRQTSARRQVGYVPEQPYFYDHLTVHELVTMYGVLVGLRGKDLRAEVDEVIGALGMSERAGNRMRSLSKGLTQRVAMAQAVIGKPQLLLLDEPFSGLDPLGRKDFKDLLGKLKRDGTTIFISSHIISDIEFLCDRASILVRGEIKGVYEIKKLSAVEGGAYELALRDCPEQLLSELGKIAAATEIEGNLVRYRFAGRESAERALTRAIDAKLMIDSYSYVQPSLEDIFVELARQKGAG